jgi:serine/threonine-protein kinase
MTHFDGTLWPILSGHLDRLLGIAEPERAAYLDEIARQNPEMAAHLRRVMASGEHRDFAAFLSEPALAASAAAPNAMLLGQMIGPYVLDEQIGRGGMGTVWRAHRVDGRYEGDVAIKLLNASLVGRPTEQRFLREGNVLAKLRHPHIAYLLDAGVATNGQPYLVLELVRGLRIDQYCDAQALTTEERIRLFLAVLAAIAHAHSHLVIHRDIKPSNILVTSDGAVKLLDFGVAGLISPESTGADASRTLDVMTALTPEYAAPEQLLNHAVTTATDVYALGLVLFVLLAGRHPYADTSESLAERVRTIVDNDAPRLSLAAATPGAARLLRGDLENIVAKALRREPQERYGTVDAFADDLKRFLADEPVKARPDSLSYRTSKFVARHRGSVMSGIVIALALVLTGGFAVQQMFEARAQRDNALAEARSASAHSELTEFLLGDSLGEVPRDTVRLRLQRAGDLVRRRFRTDPLMQARLLISLSGRYLDIGDSRDGAALMQEAQAIAHRLDDPHLNADIACGRAQDAIDAGDFKAAHAEQAVAHRNIERLKVVPSGLVAECAMSTAWIAEQEGDFAKAAAVLQTSMQALEREGVKQSPRYTSIAHEYARSLLKAGDYSRAWAAEQQVLAIVRSTGRDDSAGYYAMINVAANALLGGGQPRRAMELIDTATASARQASPNWELPYFLDATRRMAQIDSGSEQAVDAELGRIADVATKQGLGALGYIYRSAAVRAALNRADLAAAEAQWAPLGAVEPKLLSDPGWWKEAEYVVVEHARLELARQHPEEATRLLTQAIALPPANNQAKDRAALRALMLKTEIAFAKGSYDAAERDAGEALQLARAQAIDAQSSATIGEALLWRARSEAKLGQIAVAAATAHEALPQLSANQDPQSPLITMARALATNGP